MPSRSSMAASRRAMPQKPLTPGKNKGQPHEAASQIHPGATVLRSTPRSTSPRPHLHLAHQRRGAPLRLWIAAPPAARRFDAAAET